MALIANTYAAGVNGGTTPSVNTTGATFLVVSTSEFTGGTVTVSDSKSNTWSSSIASGTDSSPDTTIWYVANPTVGTGHTFTVSGTSSYATICVQAHSEVVTTSPFDVSNSTFGFSSSSPYSASSITPSADGYLVIAAFGHNVGSAVTVGSSMTITDDRPLVGGTSFGNTLAYLYQTTAAAINPAFSFTGTTNCSSVVAAFEVSTSTSKTATPATLTATVSIPAVSPTRNTTITPATVTAIVAVAAGTIAASATLAPSPVLSTVSAGAVSMIGGSTIAAATVAGVVSLPPPTVSVGVDAIVTASPVLLTSSIARGA